MKATFSMVPSGVLYRLENITSRMEENYKIRVNEHYPDHNISFTKTGIKPGFLHSGRMVEIQTSKRRRKKKKVGGWKEGDLMHVSLSDYHRCDGRISKVSSKDSKNITA